MAEELRQNVEKQEVHKLREHYRQVLHPLVSIVPHRPI